MPQTASSSRTVFRACVVNAVRAGETLMGELVKVTQTTLSSEESTVRNIQQRNLLSDGLRLLNQHESAVIKGFPMALLEIFAEGPATSKARPAEDTGMDFGELTLMDENEMQNQVELSRAQQLALHATDAVLAELNTLVSSAQGLRSVQPERNPLRPESYIRALQRVVGETGVPAEVRQLWMQHMRELLGKLLVEEYKRAAQSLREHGVEPVGYAVLGTPAGGAHGSGGRGGHGGGHSLNAGLGTGYGSGSGYSTSYGNSMGVPMGDYGSTGYGRGGGWIGDPMHIPIAPAAEEALLTVGILRQMLAGGDPFDPRMYAAGVPTQPMAMPASRSDVRGPGGGSGAHAGSGGGYYPTGAAAEAIEDMAQLERLVGRLAHGQPAPSSAWQSQAVPASYAVPIVATDSPAMAVEVVERMMENIARDPRLLPAVQRAVKSLEPPLKQLVQHDHQFFADGNHPARRLLDELTQRSLAFNSETAPGFAQFMRLLDEAVGHLAGSDIRDAGPFDTVLKALDAAWDAQEQKVRARQEAEQKNLLQAEQREMLAEKIAADIRKLSGLEGVPADVLDFAAGPWADVVAFAQVAQPDHADGDPGGYLAMVPLLLWSAQPDLTRAEPERLTEAIPRLLAKLRKGLKTINHSPLQTSAFLQRLVGLHQAAFEKPVPAPVVLPPPAPAVRIAEPAPEPLPELPAPVETNVQVAAAEAVDPYADFIVGVWVELVTNQRAVRTQLTWASPHGTLFLFTAPDGSTQSMTRRMRDKLASEGALRVLHAQPVTARALSAIAAEQPKKAAGKPPKNR